MEKYLVYSDATPNVLANYNRVYVDGIYGTQRNPNLAAILSKLQPAQRALTLYPYFSQYTESVYDVASAHVYLLQDNNPMWQQHPLIVNMWYPLTDSKKRFNFDQIKTYLEYLKQYAKPTQQILFWSNWTSWELWTKDEATKVLWNNLQTIVEPLLYYPVQKGATPTEKYLTLTDYGRVKYWCYNTDKEIAYDPIGAWTPYPTGTVTPPPAVPEEPVDNGDGEVDNSSPATSFPRKWRFTIGTIEIIAEAID